MSLPGGVAQQGESAEGGFDVVHDHHAVRSVWDDRAVVLIFLLWVAVGIVLWRGLHRIAIGGAIAAMLLTLVMLREHATDVIGLCL